MVSRDLGRYAVTCNAIAPGAQTRMISQIPAGSRQIRAKAGIQEPVRPQEPVVPPTAEHVAPMKAWLCTDDAWNVNGKIFYVQGGGVSLAHEERYVQSIHKDGKWELRELEALVPTQLLAGIPNPPPPDLDIPGRPAAKPAG